ncbi:hypothetical protein KCP75_17980 [Salmonella enterica subsp. enterica]|nr:hypothetical protein KCP75_17980 [Salmonella enterica subsp. enterica]
MAILQKINSCLSSDHRDVVSLFLLLVFYQRIYRFYGRGYLNYGETRRMRLKRGNT